MRQGGCGLLCWRQSLAGPGHTLAFVSQIFLPYSSKQQIKQEEFWCSQRIGELQGGRSFWASFLFPLPPKLLLVNNAFALLWLCSRHGQISPCLWGWGNSKATGLGLPPAGCSPSTSPTSFPSVTTACPYSFSSATQKETKHDICFLRAASAPSCPSFSEKL